VADGQTIKPFRPLRVEVTLEANFDLQQHVLLLRLF
jgi:hypothetical protein